MAPVSQIVSIKVKIPRAKVQEISGAIANTIINNKNTMMSISQKSGIDPIRTAQVLNSLHKNIDTPATEVAKKISDDTKIEKFKYYTYKLPYHGFEELFTPVFGQVNQSLIVS